MKTYTVSFFGHRNVNQLNFAIEQLERIIPILLKTNEYVEFLVGDKGDFDLLVSATIKTAQKKYDYGNSELVLVLPYFTADYRENIESYERYFDRVEICAESAGIHFKRTYQVRNQAVVDRSDMVICCIEHNSGGAFQAVQYAKKKNKKVVNLIDYFKVFFT